MNLNIKTEIQNKLILFKIYKDDENEEFAYKVISVKFLFSIDGIFGDNGGVVGRVGQE